MFDLSDLAKARDHAQSLSILYESQAQAVQAALMRSKPFSKKYERLSETLLTLLDLAAQHRRIEKQLSNSMFMNN